MKRTGILLLVFTIAFAGCGKREFRTAVKPVPVEVERVRVEGYTITRPVPGYAKAKEIILKSRGGGKVEKIFRKEGDFVKKGDKIAEIGTSIFASQLKIAEVQLKNARDEFERADRLYKKSLISKSQWEKVQAAFISAQERYSIAKVNYQLSILTAPLDGYLEDFELKTGDIVTPGYPLGKVVGRYVTEVDAFLPGEKFEVSEGDELEFTDGKGKYMGKVAYISRGYVVSGNFRKLILRTPPLDIVDGSPVTVMVPIVKNKRGILVPLDAVKFTREGKSVFVVKDGKAYEVPVKTGSIVDEKIEILSGLREGDNLVVSGQQYLKTGMRVVVK